MQRNDNIAAFMADKMETSTFTLGFDNGKRLWTNIATNHLNGKETNEMLLGLFNGGREDLLEKLAFFRRGGQIFIREEEYQRPFDANLTERQTGEGGRAGEKYFGVCRAYLLWQHLKDKKIAADNAANAAADAVAGSGLWPKEKRAKALSQIIFGFCDHFEGREMPDASKEMLAKMKAKYDSIMAEPAGAEGPVILPSEFVDNSAI